MAKLLFIHKGDKMQTIVDKAAHLTHVLEQTIKTYECAIQAIMQALQQAYDNNNTIFACGNGGSAAQAAHFVGELEGRFMTERAPIPAIYLGMDIASQTAIANDFGYSYIFSRPLSALVKEDDVLFALSTSGDSENVILALHVARQHKMRTVALLGKDGGQAAHLAHNAIIIPDDNTARIQEIHLFLIHYFCARLDEYIETKNK
jgi:D-sedoheptulose 7-phosphate isomerase